MVLGGATFLLARGDEKLDYTISRDINRTNNNYSISIYNTTHMDRNIEESGFPFQFTCNNDERVYYNAYFLKTVVKMTEIAKSNFRGLSTSYNIEIFDCDKLARDFDNITVDDVQGIIDQLLPLCIERISNKKLNNKGYLFNVNV